MKNLSKFIPFARILTFIILLCAAVPAVTAADYSGSLPVLFINTENNAEITSKDIYLSATYWLDPMGQQGVQAIGSAEAPLPMQIRGRGNYTWSGFEKKPYRLKLDKKAPLLGMNSSRHFALLAHADDSYGFLRNPVGFQLSRLIGMQWTPADAPVELVLNGEYRGLYFLTETIRVDKDRVNIVEQPDNATDPEVVTGGWLVEIDNYENDPHIAIREGDGNKIIFTYKSPEILSSVQEDYLTAQMTAVNSEIYSSDKSDCLWAKRVNLEELARFYIVQEIMDNYESFHGSCYLHKQQGEDTQWYFGPVWDFGSSFNEQKSRPIYEGRQWHNTWIAEMVKFPVFMNVVKQVWEDFYNGNFKEIYPYITSYARNIRLGAIADAKRWSQYGNADIDIDMQTVVKRVQGAAEFLNKHLEGTPAKTLEVDVYFRNTLDWDKVYVHFWGFPGGNLKVYTGDWPGVEIKPVTADGETLYHFTMSISSGLADSYQIIFNNGGSGKGNQTADLDFINNSIYDADGYVSPSGVESIGDDNDDILVRGIQGGAVIVSDIPRKVVVSGLDGVTRAVTVQAGETVIELPRGFYIIGGKKVVI